MGKITNKYKDIQVGDKYGKWTIIEKTIKYHKRSFWKCQCECGTIKEVDETTLKNGKSKGCQKCATRSVYKVSFSTWCVNNNRQDLLDRWDYELNTCKPTEIGLGNEKSFYFKCPNGIHPSKIMQIVSIVNNRVKTICIQCNSFAQYLINLYGETALVDYWDFEKNTVNPWEIPHSWNKKVWLKCVEKDYHENYEISCNAFCSGHRCSYCSHQKIHPLDSLGALYPEILEIWSDKNKKSPYEYSAGTAQKAWFKCKNNTDHDDYYIQIKSAVSHKFRCPQCTQERSESILQEKVRTYITEEYLNYKLNHEYNCTIIPQNPKMKNKNGRLPFDNEIEDLKLIIEVHGGQHYSCQPYSSIWNKKKNTPEQALHYQRLKDRYKKYISYLKGYSYLEIPYWTDNKDESYKQLIDNKIAEILNNQ